MFISGVWKVRVGKGVKVVRELLRSKRTLLAAAVLCVVLIASLTILWQGSHVAEAAVLYPHPGLVGWWRFDEGVGSVAKDSSEFGNDGTVYGATWVDGKYGEALSFNGVNNYVLIPNADSLNFGTTTDFSIDFWLNPTAINWHIILNKKDTSSGITVGYQIATHNNALYAFIGDGVNGIIVISAPISSNVWQYCTLVAKRSGSAQWYVNGVPSGNPVSMAAIGNMNNTRNLYIGGSDSYFYGILDEVRICNRALSAAEIQESFQKSPDFSSKLLAKVPKGTTQVIVTLSWQGLGSINVTVVSPSKNYTEDIVPVYQKTVYSTSDGTSNMLNIKRLSVSVSALSSDENWYVVLKFDDVDAYKITVEVQK